MASKPWQFQTAVQKTPLQATSAGASYMAAAKHTHKKIGEVATAQTNRNASLVQGGGSGDPRGTMIVPQYPEAAGGKSAFGPNSANDNVVSAVHHGNLTQSQTQYDGLVAPVGTQHQSSAGNPPSGPTVQGGGTGGIDAYYGICGPSCPYFGGPPQFIGGRMRTERRRRRRRKSRRSKRKRRRRYTKKRRIRRKRSRRSSRVRPRRRNRKHLRGGSSQCRPYRPTITPSFPIYEY